MGPDKLGHGECAHPILAEDFGHLGVGGEIRLLLGVLEIVLFEIGPESFDALRPRSFVRADERSQLGGKFVNFIDAGSFLRHGENTNDEFGADLRVFK